MELKLKDDSETTKKTNGNPAMDLDDDFISGEGTYGSYTNNPVKISTVVEAPIASKKSLGLNLYALARFFILAAAILGLVVLISNAIHPDVTDVTSLVNKNIEEVEKALDITLNENSGMKSQINQYSDRTVTVYGDGDIGVVYIDDQYAGLHINDKKYSIYGVKIGDSELSVENNMTYLYDECINVLNDMAEGNSTADFYYNKVKGDCLVVIYNDHSNRVVAMTYFNNYKKVTENLGSIGDDE